MVESRRQCVVPTFPLMEEAAILRSGLHSLLMNDTRRVTQKKKTVLFEVEDWSSQPLDP